MQRFLKWAEKNQEEVETMQPSKNKRQGKEPDLDSSMQVPQQRSSSGSSVDNPAQMWKDEGEGHAGRTEGGESRFGPNIRDIDPDSLFAT